jgi:hypothetical protein
MIPELESNIYNGTSLVDPLSKILAPIIDLK